MKINITAFNAGPLQRIPVKGITFETKLTLGEILKGISQYGSTMIAKGKFLYKDENGSVVLQEKEVTLHGKAWGRFLSIRSHGSAVGGDLYTDIKLPE